MLRNIRRFYQPLHVRVLLMSRIPTIRVKSTNPDHPDGFFIRNADDLKYGEELFMAEEFARLGEHAVRIKIASLSSDDDFVVEGNIWLKLKEQELSAKVDADRIARESATLSVAKEANDIARTASLSATAAAAAASEANAIARSNRRISISSAIAAIVAAIAAIKWR